MDYINILSDKGLFTRSDLQLAMQACGMSTTTASMKKKLNEGLTEGYIARAGRNSYYIPKSGEQVYQYNYSELSNEVAQLIIETHPYLRFSISELIQINEFANHQMAHNIVFLSVEEDVIDFVFDTVKEKYPGKVLLNPSPELFHQYWYDNMIVITKLVTEAPKGKTVDWHTKIEKLLVDLMVEPLWQESVSDGDLPLIFTDAFSRYIVDESCLFRYAKRRTSEYKIRKFIGDHTSIKLRSMR